MNNNISPFTTDNRLLFRKGVSKKKISNHVREKFCFLLYCMKYLVFVHTKLMGNQNKDRKGLLYRFTISLYIL